MLGGVLVIIYLIGIYTHVHLLWQGTVLVPVVFSGLAGTLLLLKNFRRIPGRDCLALGTVLLVAWLSVVFGGPDDFFFERVKGGIQLSYSIIFAYAFFLELAHWQVKRIEKLFQYISVGIIIGCILEN